MISDARKAWLRDTLRGLIARRFPNLLKTHDLINSLFEKQRDRLLDSEFHRELKVVKEKAKPFLWAYLAGCCAPVSRKHARSS